MDGRGKGCGLQYLIDDEVTDGNGSVNEGCI